MSDDSEEVVRRPAAIFIETSILWKLPPSLNDAKLQNLLQLAAILKVRTYIPELCVREYLEEKGNQLRAMLSRTKGALEKLRDFLQQAPNAEFPSDESVIPSLKIFFLRSLNDNGIDIVGNATVSENQLLDLAVKHVKPFEEKDKGFKDTVILLSMLETSRGLGATPVLLIAEDSVFGHEDVVNRAASEGVQLLVARSIDEAIGLLEQVLTREQKDKFDEREAKLRGFLLANREQITEHIRKDGSIDPYSVGLVKIAEIKKIALEDVQRALAGFLPDGVREGRVDVYFVAKFEVQVIGEPLHYPPPPPRIKLQEGAVLEEISPAEHPLRGLLGWPPWPSDLIETTIHPTFAMKASVKSSEPEEYSDLKIESTLPSGMVAKLFAEE